MILNQITLMNWFFLVNHKRTALTLDSTVCIGFTEKNRLVTVMCSWIVLHWPRWMLLRAAHDTQPFDLITLSLDSKLGKNMTLLSIIWLQLVGTICKLPERDTYRRASRGRETLWVTVRTAAVSNSFQTDALIVEPSYHLDNRWLTVLLKEPLIESLSRPQNTLHGLDGLFVPVCLHWWVNCSAVWVWRIVRHLKLVSVCLYQIWRENPNCNFKKCISKHFLVHYMRDVGSLGKMTPNEFWRI